MVFETLVISLLNRFLGDFIDNVKTEQLNIALFSGNVVLENLALKRGALDMLNLPIDIKHGYLGKLTLKIPWTNLKGEPLYVHIDRVYAVASPKFSRKYDAAEEAKEALELKKQMIERFEAFKAQRLEAEKVTSNNSEKGADFLTKLVTKIIDNLQVTIGTIHIRYEDELSNPQHPIAVGVTLNGLSALSTNSQWQPGIVKGQADAIYKVANLDSIALYWDSYPTFVSGLPSNELRDKLTSLIPSSNKPLSEHHSFILKPLSATAKLRLDPSPVPALTSPQVMAEIAIEDLGLVLDDEQLNDVFKVASFFAAYVKGEKYRRFRPARGISVIHNPRAYWKFAQQAVLFDVHDKKRRWEWKFFLKRREDRKTYIATYKAWKTTNKNDIKTKLEEQEKDLEYADIVFYRSIADVQLKKEKQAAKVEGKSNWFTKMISGKKKTAEATVEPELSEDQLMKQLYETIDYDESVPTIPTVFPKEYNRFKFDISLKSLGLSVRNRLKAINQSVTPKCTPLLDFAFRELTTTTIVRPSSISVTAGVQSLRLIDRYTKNTLYPNIINGGSDKGPFITFAFDDHPLDAPGVDMRIRIQTEPIEIIVPAEVMVKTIIDFVPPQDDYLLELQRIATENLSVLTEQTRLGLMHQVSKKVTIAIEVNARAPLIILPESVTDATKAVIALDLGRVGVTSSLISPEDKDKVLNVAGALTPAKLQELRDLMYDRFQIDVDAFQIVLAGSMKEAREALSSKSIDKSRCHLLQPIAVTMVLDKCILINEPDLPLVKIHGSLPLVGLTVSDVKFQLAMRILLMGLPHIKELLTNPKLHPPVLASPVKFELIEPVFVNAVPFSESVTDLAGLAEEPVAKYVEPPQLQQVTISFVVDQIILQVTSEQEGDQPLLAVQLRQTSFRMKQRTFDLDLDLSIDSVTLLDLSRTLSDPIIDLRATDNGKAVRLALLQTLRSSPSFLLSDAVDQKITTEVGKLNVNVEANSLVKLIRFFKSAFIPPSDFLLELSSVSVTDTRDLTSASDSSINLKNIKAATVDQTIMLVAGLQGISVSLQTDSNETIVIASIGTTAVTVDVAGQAVKVAGTLGGLLVSKPMATMPAIDLVATQGDSTLSFNFATYVKNTSSYPGYDMSLRLRTTVIEVTYVHEAIQALISSLIKFAEFQKEVQAELLATQAAAMSQMNFAQSQLAATLFQMDIVIGSPRVIIKRSVTSRDQIEADLGEITVRNKFETIPKSTSILDVMTLQLAKVALFTQYEPASGFVLRDALISDFAAALEIRRLVEGPSADMVYPGVEIVGSMRALQLQVSNRQILFLVTIADELGEKITSLVKELETQFAPTPSASSEIAADVSQPVSKEVKQTLQTLDLAVHIESIGIKLIQEDNKILEDLPQRRFPLLEMGIENIDARVLQRSDTSVIVEVVLGCLAARDKRAVTDNIYLDAISSGKVSLAFSQTPTSKTGNAISIVLTARDFTVTLIPELYLTLLDTVLVPLQDFQVAKENQKRIADTNAVLYEKASSSGTIANAQLLRDFSSASSSVSNMSIHASSASKVLSSAANTAGALNTNKFLQGATAVADLTTNTVNNLTNATIQSNAMINEVHQSTKDIAPAKKNPSNSLLLNMQLLNTKIRIVADSTRADSLGFLIEQEEMYLKMVDEHLELEIENVSILSAIIAAPSDASLPEPKKDQPSEFFIMDPFGASITIVQNNDITIEAQPLKLRVSYQDIRIGSRLYELILPGIEKSDALHPERRQRILKELAEHPEDYVLTPVSLAGTERVTIDELSSEESVDNLLSSSSAIIMPSTTPDAVAAAAAAPAALEKLSLKLNGMRLVVVNDCGDLNVPLLLVDIKPLDLAVANWSSRLALDTSVGLQIDWFNMKLSAWETIAEPWSVSLQVSKESAKAGTKLSIKSPERLEFSVTADLLKAVIEIADQWTAGFQKKHNLQNSVRVDYLPYIIQNETGLSLVIKTSSELPPSLKSTWPIQLAHGDKKRFALHDWRDFHKERQLVEDHCITIEFSDGLFDPVEQMPIARLGQRNLILQSTNAALQHRLVCDITFVDGHRVIVIRSPVVLLNHAAAKIFVAVQTLDTKTRVEIPLDPGQSYSVPILSCATGQFSIRHDSEKHTWSEYISGHVLFQKGLLPAISPTTSGKEESFNYYLSACYDNNKKRKKQVWPDHSYPAWRIFILSPWQLENHLPVDIHVDLSDQKGEVVETAKIEPGKTKVWTKAQYNETYTMLLRLPEVLYETREPVRLKELGDHENDVINSVVHTSNKLSGDTVAFRLTWSSWNKLSSTTTALRAAILTVPYLIINKSELFLFFKQAARLTGPGIELPQNATVVRKSKSSDGGRKDEVQLTLFSYPNLELLTKQQAIFRTKDSEWTSSITFEGTGSEGEVSLVEGKDKRFQLGMQISVGEGRYLHTKVISFAPRYVIVNRSPKTIEFLGGDLSQVQVDSDQKTSRITNFFSSNNKAILSPAALATQAVTWRESDIVRVEPGQRRAIHFAAKAADVRIVRLRTSKDIEWSTPLFAEGVGVDYVKSQLTRSLSHIYRVEKTVQGATTFLEVYLQTEAAPYRIDNKTPLPLAFLQVNDQIRYVANPVESVPFVWDNPLETKRSIIINFEGKMREVDLSLIGDHKPVKFEKDNRLHTIYLKVIAESSTTALQLTSKISAIEKSKTAAQAVTSMFSKSKTPEASSDKDNEISFVSIDSKPIVSVMINLAGLGVSLVSAKPQELMYISLQDLLVDFVDADIDQTLQMSIAKFQIDNQLPNPDFPVILHQVVMKNKKNAEGKDVVQQVLHVSFRRIKYRSQGVVTFQNLSVLLQELSLEISESFLMKIVEFGMSLVPKGSASIDAYGDVTPGIPSPPVNNVANSDKLYFEIFELQPIKINITFVRSRERGSVSATEMAVKSDLLRIIVDVLSMSLANIENAPMRFNALALKHLMTPATTLGELIGKYYAYQVVSQLHLLVGSVDLIGNPVGLFFSISTGVEDFFYEPYQGLARGPKDFALGLGVGSVSLVRNLGYGVLDTTSKISGSIGKGVAQVTMDDQYLAERDAARLANRNQNAAGGTLAGAQAVFNGFAGGVTGIFSKPIQGAKEGGFTGFLTGTAKGAIGVIAKPVVGILDGASQIAVGLRNQTKMSSEEQAARVRLPRHFGADHVLKPYNPRLALGTQWLQLVNAGEYADYVYEMHLDVTGTTNVVMLTDRAVLLFSPEKMQVKWTVHYKDMTDVQSGQDTVCFYERSENSGGSVKTQEFECLQEELRKTFVMEAKSSWQSYHRESVGEYTDELD